MPPVTSGTAPPREASREHLRGQLLVMLVAFSVTLPGLVTRIAGYHPPDYVGPVVYGFAILGSAFLLAWGAEVLQLDVSQGLALTVLALIAVLPEYAVDFAFAWKAGDDPDQYAPLALANMTGANRLLIGVGWSMVVILAAWRMTRIARQRGYRGEIDTQVRLERPHAIEIMFLSIATVYSLTLPLKRTLTLVDAVILVGIFAAFVFRIARAPAEEPHLVGPARVIGTLPTAQRRAVVGILLVYSAVVIFACAEPFAESLVHLGEEAGIDTFLLVQWLAPLASEAPELLVAGLFAWRLQTSAGLGTLLSSKVNQWTLLVGSLPIVFAISSGALHGLPLDALQREELFLTAAQSVFAIAVLANRSMSVREAWMLFALFFAQFVLGGVLPEDIAEYERIAVGVLYLLLAFVLLFRERQVLRPLAHDGLFEPVDQLFKEPDGETHELPPWARPEPPS
jgi:cation:H+ antiporter